jgi:hypothetical protein
VRNKYNREESSTPQVARGQHLGDSTFRFMVTVEWFLWVLDHCSFRPKGSSGLPVAPARHLGYRDAPTRGKSQPTRSLRSFTIRFGEIMRLSLHFQQASRSEEIHQGLFTCAKDVDHPLLPSTGNRSNTEEAPFHKLHALQSQRPFLRILIPRRASCCDVSLR